MALSSHCLVFLVSSLEYCFLKTGGEVILHPHDMEVRGGDYRLFDRVICRLNLKVGDIKPKEGSLVQASVFLLEPPHSSKEVPITEFPLHRLRGWVDCYIEWRLYRARGKCDQSFGEYLLRKSPDVRLQFQVENDRLHGLELTLDPSLKLQGLLPPDQNILTEYFGTTSESTD